MHLNVDTARARQMARTLKDFLDQEATGRYRHVNALEATARMLGFRNHNAMLASLESAPATPQRAATVELLPAEGRLDHIPVTIVDPGAGDACHDATEIRIDLRRLLANRDLLARIVDAHDHADGRLSPRLFADHPDVAALIAALPVVDPGDIDSTVWLDTASWLEHLDDAIQRLLDRDFGDSFAITQLKVHERRTVLAELAPTPIPDPIEGDARVLAMATRITDPGDPTAFETRYHVVVHRGGAWQHMLAVQSHDQALAAAAAFAGQPVEGNRIDPGPAPDDARFPDAPRLYLGFEMRENPEIDPDQQQAIGSVYINGVAHHITLTAVTDRPETEDPDDEEDEDAPGGWYGLPDDSGFTGAQIPENDQLLYRMAALQDFEGGEDSFRAIPHDTGQYVCVITPYSR